MMKTINKLIKDINKLSSHLSEKDFLLTWEQSPDELKQVLDVAAVLKTLRSENIATTVFNSGLGISIFRDNSTRTRFSYASALNLLGLAQQDLDEGKSQIAHGETVRETANMIAFCADVIGIRDDMYLGAGHAYMREVGEALDDGYMQGVLPQRPALINLQCDIDHPTQAMADLAWLREHFGSLENLKGKKLAMTWAYSPSYGKPLSVPQGIIGLMTRFGMDVTLAHPEGYDLIPDVIDVAKINAITSGGVFRQITSMEEAFRDADIVYPKSWAPYNVMAQRTRLLRINDHDGLVALEKACLAQNARHKNWHCTEAMMKLTRNGKALYMHCLPADITGVSCKEGEVTQEVFEKYRIATYKEASWKPYIIAAMIMCRKFTTPGQTLAQRLKEAEKRLK
ncbi:knotted carbamoyltransferase YgeW [Salmonella enterica subsp. enterica serovar Plymouth]|uniref:Knotted carbamoyltransferase YgeW n=1 Tax=Salmonella enteritidis TaxID=149539 RepID=A0A5V0BDQ1_SALEN|nr:knotted carbamoyltransferase YgeW [Salmonella enterica subsp. enterica serovar Enteritidis]EBS5544029.1 knotted carbamoyltransferase YgeW [Salmonella enterica subsp. enterica serovar Plymouth]EBW7768448.1 knotted carbamoyltransferase YgeW [Salmonella enterica subsp. enterica serovar Louisiana]ECI5768743.1 knotted carbamoyltransferase YgeW [Salmonella enterica subsp. enterica]MID13596.1 knotted carbamoyltransferase YgeW [Salmonella enterica]